MSSFNYPPMKPSLLALLIASALSLSACAVQNDQDATSPDDQPRYDQSSWKSMIPDSCDSFFDGCNNCKRTPGSELAACTRKYCEVYEKPRCLDDEL